MSSRSMRDSESRRGGSIRDSTNNSFRYVNRALSKRLIDAAVQEDDDTYHDEDPSINTFAGEALHSEDTYLGSARNKVGKFVNSRIVQTIMTCIIIGNAILLGVLTLDVIRFNKDLFDALEWLDIAILITFTIEFGCQFFYLGPMFIKYV